MDKRIEEPFEPFISVIVTVYNQADLIIGCVRSLVNQNYRNYEIIVVDALSSDGTWELLQNLKRKYKIRNLNLVRKPGNASAGRNCGIEMAKGEICAFIDSDASASEDWLNKIVETFNSLEGDDLLVGVGGTSLLPKNSSRKSSVFYHVLGSPLVHGGRLNPSVQLKREAKGFVGHIPTCNLAIKKSVFSREGKFDESFDSGEDLELSTRLRLKGYKLFCSPEIRVEHHQRNSIPSFSRQICGWGKGKGLVIKKFGLVNKVYLLPLFVLVFAVALLVLSFSLAQQPFSALVLFLALLCYVVLVSTESARIASNNRDKLLFLYGLFLFPLIHLLSTLGLLEGLVKNPEKIGKR
ncbi:MAG TPA: glycosyltransferase [Thermoplasmata archaeon]|nr:glycosyltransferase [Thermoplasmata archaeon]